MGSNTVVILFIFGAAVASGKFMPRLLRPPPYDMSVMQYLRSNGCPSAPELAPVICQFMEPHTGLFKPQLIAPTTFIPPLVVEKPQLEIILPPRKPIVIPEAPILSPITIPRFPVPVFEPLPVPIVEPCEPAPFAVAAGGAGVDVMVTGLNIPAAPVLPPLEMPAMPEFVGVGVIGADISGTVIEDQTLMVAHRPALEIPALSVVPPMVAPYPEDELISGPIPEFIAPLAPIQPVRLPEIPVRVEIPHPMPPMIIEHFEEPRITGEIVHPKPMIIAPPLRIPEPMPILPAREPTIIAEPCDPALQPVMKMSGSSSYIPAPAMGPALYPAQRMLPYMRRI